MDFYVDLLICPICRGRLSSSHQALTCPKRHTFDLARKDYVNLSRNRHSGDHAEMLRARRRFLG